MKELEDKLIDFIDQKLDYEEMKKVENAITQSEALNREYLQLKGIMQAMDIEKECLPSVGMRHNFESFLAEEIEKAEHSKAGVHDDSKIKHFDFRALLKYAAAGLVLVVVGVLLGQNITKDQQLTAMASELQESRTEMFAMLDENSTSQRIKAVNIGYNFTAPDSDILNALIQTMNTDESSNVRLAAVNALEKFSNERKVVDALVESLDIQKDPMVTITLINILASIKEEKALEKFEKIAKNENHLNYVKDEAELGIITLKTI